MKTYDYSDPQAAAQEQIAQKARLAELLMRDATSNAPVYSNRAGLARLLSGALAGHQMRSAGEEKKALAEKAQATRSSEMDAIIAASESPDPNKRLALAKLLARSSDPGMQQTGLGMLMKGPGKVEWKDAGDKLVGIDETGRPIPGMEMPKGVGPDARFRHENVDASTRYRTETVDAGTRLTHGTPSASAMMTDQRARSEGAANRALQAQGQQMTDARSRDATAAVAGGKAREDVDGIRKEFNALPEVKNYRSVVPVIESARKASDTPQGDLALVYAVGKALDPNSVVREGEMALVLKSGSLMERIVGSTRMNFGKGRLTPEMRTKLLGMLDQRANEYKTQHDAARQTYEGIAKERGYDPSQIFTDAAGGPKRIASDADFNALPSGAEFIDPEGNRRRKP